MLETKAAETAALLLEQREEPDWRGLTSVRNIQHDFGIDNANFIKPGVGETTRVLLRRVPWKILIQPGSAVGHIGVFLNRNTPVFRKKQDMCKPCPGARLN